MDYSNRGYQRNEHGVRVRADGGGDAWANLHRNLLGRDCYIQDVDAMFGHVTFGHNTGDALFLEYVPDNIENRRKILRRFAYVAMFDRKASNAAAFGAKNSVSFSMYLNLCRRIAEGQPVPPKFFFVIGRDRPPWQMIEIDIYSGEEIGNTELHSVNWKEIWAMLGLESLRRELLRWVDPGVR